MRISLITLLLLGSLCAGCASTDAGSQKASGNSAASPPPEAPLPEATSPAEGGAEATTAPEERVASPEASPAPGPVETTPAGESPVPEGAPAESAPERTGATPRDGEGALAESVPSPRDEGTRAESPAAKTPAAAARPGKPPSYVIAMEASSGGPTIEVDIALEDPGAESELAGEVVVGGDRFLLRRYAPSLAIRERLVPSPPGQPGAPALELAVTAAGGQKQSIWLVPGSRLLGRLAVRSALITCVPQTSAEGLDALEKQQRQLQAPGPKVVLEIKRDGRQHVFPVKEGEKRTADGYELEFVRLFQTFALDPKTGKPKDQDPRPLNPALELRISHGGRTRTALLFSQLPEFSREGEDEGAVLRLVYPLTGHPHPRAEITIADSASGPYKVFAGIGGKFHKGEIPRNGSLLLPGLELSVAQRIPAARVDQTATVDPRGRPAVLLGWRKGDVAGERWIPLGVREELRLGDTAYQARLLPAGQSPHGSMLRPGATGGHQGPRQGFPPGHPSVGVPHTAPPPRPSTQDGSQKSPEKKRP